MISWGLSKEELEKYFIPLVDLGIDLPGKLWIGPKEDNDLGKEN